MTEYSAIWQNLAADRSFELDRLVDSAGELRVELSDNAGRKVVIRFDSHLCYRRMDEGDALNTIRDLAATAGTAKVFYRAQNSDFLDWFHVQSQGVYLDRALQHFAICTVHDIIDVIAFKTPDMDVGEPPMPDGDAQTQAR